MSMKRFTGSGFNPLSTFKRWTGSAWQTLTTAKRFNGSQWINLLDGGGETGTITKTYSLKAAQNYWAGGSKDNQFPAEHIQGKWTGVSIRRSLLIFDGNFAADLQGATISKVELYLQRSSSSHGISGGANVKIKTHGYTSLPSTWSGTDTGDADSGTPTLKRGEGKWLTLLNSVGTGLKNGTIGGLALDADSSTSTSDYVRYVKSATKLRITYTR